MSIPDNCTPMGIYAPYENFHITLDGVFIFCNWRMLRIAISIIDRDPMEAVDCVEIVMRDLGRAFAMSRINDPSLPKEFLAYLKPEERALWVGCDGQED